MPNLILHSILHLSCVACLVAHEALPDAVSLLQLPRGLQVVPGGSKMEKEQHGLVQSQVEQTNSIQSDGANFTAIKEPNHGARTQTQQQVGGGGGMVASPAKGGGGGGGGFWQDVHSGRTKLHSNFPLASFLQAELELLAVRASSFSFFEALWYWVLAPIFFCTGCCCCCCLCAVLGSYYQTKSSHTEFADGLSSGAEELQGVLAEPTFALRTEKVAKVKQALDKFLDSMGQDSQGVKSLEDPNPFSKDAPYSQDEPYEGQ
mmetsp:Transcript_131661/g.228913  ORF Transcript_131661/g.228913 Transcript_131661/m.228913 type:complete len:261 (-) Transcript_131661:29-811(-)